MKLFDYLQLYALTRPQEVAVENSQRAVTYQELWILIIKNKKRLEKEQLSGNKVIINSKDQLKFAIALLSLLAGNVWVVPITGEMTEIQAAALNKEYNIKQKLPMDFFQTEAEDIDLGGQLLQEQVDQVSGIYHMTSGSTGIPKLCIRTAAALCQEGEAYHSTLHLNPEDRIMSLSPIGHSYALGSGLMAALVSGISLFVTDHFTPRQAIQTIQVWNPSIIIAVPIMIKLISTIWIDSPCHAENLRITLVGAGALELDLQEKFKERFGIYTSSNYGSTETGGIITRIGVGHSTSIGVPMPGVRIKLLDNNNKEVGTGQEGRVFARVPYGMEGYVNTQPEEVFQDGYFAMGDLMYQGKEGEYYITGRIKNLINIGGKKVNPVEVEQALHKHPDIIDCYVYGKKKNNGEEAVKALVVAHSCSETDLRQFLKQYLNSYQIPSEISFQPEIIRNSVGKVTKDNINL